MTAHRMTVRDLIDYLKQFDGDLPVYADGIEAPDADECVTLDTIPLIRD